MPIVSFSSVKGRIGKALQLLEVSQAQSGNVSDVPARARLAMAEDRSEQAIQLLRAETTRDARHPGARRVRGDRYGGAASGFRVKPGELIAPQAPSIPGCPGRGAAFWPCRECSDDQAVRALAGRSASGKALQYANRCEGPEWVSRVHTRGRGNSQLGAPIACGNIQEKRTARRLGRIHIIRHFGKKNSTSC